MGASKLSASLHGLGTEPRGSSPAWRCAGQTQGEQTRKLFEACRLRDVSIITFVNKLDRESRDPFDLLDEIEQPLALDVTPASWAMGMGRDFLGTYDLFADVLLVVRARSPRPSHRAGPLLRPR